MRLSEVDDMKLTEYYSWLKYFSLLNGTDEEDKKEQSNGELVSFLRSKKG